MADDIQLPGTGSSVATEDIGGKHHQKVIQTDPSGKMFDPDDLVDILTAMLTMLKYPVYYDRALNKLRVDVSGQSVVVSSATLAANQDIRNVTTVATVTNVAQIDTYPGKLAVVGINTTAWALSCRNLIT